MGKSLAPIALFVYNRPVHTRRAIKALQKNELAYLSDLYIFSDAPKNDSAKPGVAEVREFLPTIQGFKTVNVIERDRNYGLASSIIDGVTQLCNLAGEVIVLEDDLETSPYFLNYMRDALDLYRYDDAVISIHGYIYPTKDVLPESFFLRGADCWGWATWKRGWDLFEVDAQVLITQIKKKNCIYDFNFNGQYDYFGMLQAQAEGQNNSWAIRWYASAYLKNKLTLYPGRSLVANIGNDNSGTHCGNTDVFLSTPSPHAIAVSRIALDENADARLSFERYFRSIKTPFLYRVLEKVRGLW